MNEQIVDDALADIALNPDQHDQATFGHKTACGGNKMCLAGFILLRAGYTLQRVMTEDCEWIKTPPAVWHNPAAGEPVDACLTAMEIAGMTGAQAHVMFIDSATDNLKELTSRWNRMTGREL